MGVDVGATLAKLASRSGDGSLQFQHVPSHAIERAADEVERLRPNRLGLTGGGAHALAPHLDFDTVPVNEFDAWRLGAGVLLERQGEDPSDGPDLLVSVGTGTAVLLREAAGIRWVGGTALGGGTLTGLGAALLGTSEFHEVVALAGRGDRGRVDLLVKDIYPDGSLQLPGDMNAASFAKLSRAGEADSPSQPDLAHALVGLVGEGIAGIVAALAAATAARRIVVGGSALRDNPPLREILAKLAGLGRHLIFLEDGGYTAAVGALLSAETAATRN